MEDPDLYGFISKRRFTNDVGGANRMAHIYLVYRSAYLSAPGRSFASTAVLASPMLLICITTNGEQDQDLMIDTQALAHLLIEEKCK